MTVLTIRAHKRYAVRQTVRLKTENGRPVKGLMIELSTEGCRISNLGANAFTEGETVAVDCGNRMLHGVIRWAHDGFAGVRLGKPLLGRELATWIGKDRVCEEPARYGT